MRIEWNAPITLVYALAALAATLTGYFLPVEALFAVHGPLELSPEFLLSLVTWTLVHADLNHLISNYVVILLAGPVLEKLHGSAKMFWVYLSASVLVGIAHVLLAPREAVIGASGTVFAVIMMMGLAAGRDGRLPATFLLVAAFYFGKEAMAMLQIDDVSQTAHLLGGLLGILLGRPLSRAPGSWKKAH